MLGLKHGVKRPWPGSSSTGGEGGSPGGAAGAGEPGCAHTGSRLTLRAVRVQVFPAPNCSISLLVLTLPHSQAGSSLVTADQFNALFGTPSITKATASFACVPEFAENAAAALMALGMQSHYLWFLVAATPVRFSSFPGLELPWHFHCICYCHARSTNRMSSEPRFLSSQCWSIMMLPTALLLRPSSCETGSCA